MASTPLPVVYPTSARHAASSGSSSSDPRNLRLSIPSSPNPPAAPLSNSSVRTVELEEKDGVGPPPPATANDAYAAAYPVGSRTSSQPSSPTNHLRLSTGSTSSLPPTRVASPRISTTKEDQKHRSNLSSASSTSSNAALPASRADRGLTSHASRPPIPLTRGRPAPSKLGRLTACFKAPLTPSTIFDLHLTSLVDTYNRLPACLDLSIEYLEQHLDESGDFFTAVPEKKLQELVNYLEDAGEGEINLKSLAFYGVSAIGAFLKRVLDQLPEPLLTYVRYDQFCKAASFTPVGPQAIASGAQSPHSPTAATRSAFPILRGGDEHDQALLMQSLVVSLPGAHFLLLERLVRLMRRMVDYATQQNPHAASRARSTDLQRLSLIFCSSILVPRFSPTHPASNHEASMRRAQEQQVLTYLIAHYDDVFHRNAIRDLASVPPSATHVVDLNPALQEDVTRWRQMAGNLKVNFSRRHFDSRTLVRAFRAWRATSKTNRRKAEAYRQLALLKQELLQEKQKNASLTRELYGLKEEYELRDFQDQLRMQTTSISAQAYAPPATTSKYAHDEKESMSSFSTGVGPSSRAVLGSLVGAGSHRPAGVASAGGVPRDLAADLASVRALQNQDRALTQAYSRY